MTISRRAASAASLVAGPQAAPAPAAGRGATHPTRLVVPWGPGGANDLPVPAAAGAAQALDE